MSKSNIVTEGPGDDWLLRTPPHPHDGDYIGNGDDAEADAIVNEARAEIALEESERHALFAKNPNCDKCKQPITDAEEAFIVRRASGETVLIHWVDTCFSREVQEMLDRYLDDKRKPKIRWIERAVS